MRKPFLFTLAVMLASAIGPATAGEAVLEKDLAARKLYVGKCAKCHKLYDPAKYSDQQWQVWMNKMSRKAKLQPEQKEMLARYIEDSLRLPRREIEPKPAMAR